MRSDENRCATLMAAIGCDKGKPEAEAFLRDFVEDAKASGLVARLIAQHKVQGLSVAPAA